MRFAIFQILLGLISLSLYSQENSSGVRSLSLGGLLSLNENAVSALSNPAGLARIKSSEILTGTEQRFMLKELSSQFISLAIPLARGGIGGSYSRYGYDLYNRSKFALAFGMKISSMVEAGILLYYYRSHYGEDYGDYQWLSGDVSVRIIPEKSWVVSGWVQNPFQPSVNRQKLEVGAGFGVRKQMAESVITALEITRNPEDKVALRAGIEYEFFEKIFLRAGLRDNLSGISFGAGFHTEHLFIDAGSSYTSGLGFSPAIQLGGSL